MLQRDLLLPSAGSEYRNYVVELYRQTDSRGKEQKTRMFRADGNGEQRVVGNFHSQLAHPAVGLRNRLPKLVTTSIMTSKLRMDAAYTSHTSATQYTSAG
jgi:hypothetical protein